MLRNKELLITNNPLVNDRLSDKIHVIFVDTDMSGVLTCVRDHIHKGHSLLTHPLSGSIKPNETIYKSVLISEERGQTDEQSVNIIEEAVMTAQKFTQKHIPEQYLHDLQTIDFSLISGYITG